MVIRMLTQLYKLVDIVPGGNWGGNRLRVEDGDVRVASPHEV